MTRLRFRVMWLGLSAALACTSNTSPEPEERPPAELNIIQLPTNHRPFFNTEVSFYAKVGRDAEAAIYFQDDHGERGDRFAELEIEARSLLTKPDGTPFVAGDSVLITMRILDPVDIQVELLPSGLKFSSTRPAELKLEYKEAHGDFNRDGKHDDEDDSIEGKLSIWRQENPGDPFVKIGTIKSNEAELKADLTGFSRWAIAY